MTDETLLLRQINPSFVQEDKVSSQAFRPTPKDRRKLSVYDGDLITAERAWAHFTSQGFRSAGVLAVAVAECPREQLVVRSSPEHFPEHAEIDFQDFTLNECKRIAERLRDAAKLRGWRFQIEPQ